MHNTPHAFFSGDGAYQSAANTSLKTRMETRPHKTLRRLAAMCVVLPLVAGLAACSEGPNQTWPRVTLNESLQERYQSSCRQCHESPASGAPLTGDSERWQGIMSKGLDAVMQGVMQGVGGMPPGGQCFACTPAELEQLVRYMAGAKS